MAERCRIIPANTGKIFIFHAHRLLPRDHPREYGENQMGYFPLLHNEGSSPRIRGKSAAQILHRTKPGIIPANTGKMACRSGLRGDRADHPREYGENLVGMKTPQGMAGSSPRIRGKCDCGRESIECCRIIPANTGKMKFHCLSTQGTKDHPREYGENCSELILCDLVSGSSPRIRGK